MLLCGVYLFFLRGCFFCSFSLNDLAVYFGTHRPHVTSELRLVTPLEGQVFDDAMMRPRFAVLRFILDLC